MAGQTGGRGGTSPFRHFDLGLGEIGAAVVALKKSTSQWKDRRPRVAHFLRLAALRPQALEVERVDAVSISTTWPSITGR
jgi:hypothetical protein